MSEWKIKKLSEVADIIGGGTPSSKENAYYDNGTIPWITPKDLSNYNEMYISNGERNITELGLKNSSAKLLPKGSILFSSRAPIGYVAIANKELSTNQGFKSLVLKEGHVPEFYYYLLKQNVALFEARASGTTFKEVSGQIVKDTELSIPDKETQGKIVSILKPLDDKIQLNTETNKTLEAIAQAIFKHWFIDFAPVHAKAEALAEGKTAKQAELAAMASISGKTEAEITELAQTNPQAYQQLQQTAAAFPSEFVESELGLVPKGWEVKKIEQVIKKIPVGKKYSQKNTFPEGNIPVLDQGKSGIIGFHNDTAGVKANIQDPVIVFANHTCYMRLIHFDFSAIQNVFAFKGSNLNIYWVYLATLGKQEFVEYKGHFPDFLIKQIIVPPKELTEIFGKIVKDNFSKIALNLDANEKLAKTRDLLLPRLLNNNIVL